MIYGFLHIYTAKEWRNIITQQVGKMKVCGLLDKTDTIYCGVVGTKVFEPIEDCMKIMYDSPNLNLLEVKTLYMLWQLCRSLDCQVFFIHTKDLSNGWRRQMEHSILVRHNLCLKFLNEGADIVAADWSCKGNFWWANSSFIKTLPAPDQCCAEDWLSKGKPTIIELEI
jgi:hypothetical protein